MEATEVERNGSPAEARVPADEARRLFGEVVDRARDGEVIIVTRHGNERVVVLDYREYERLRALEQQQGIAE